MKMYTRRSQGKKFGKLLWLIIGIVLVVLIVMMIRGGGGGDPSGTDNDTGDGKNDSAGVAETSQEKSYSKPTRKVDPDANKPAPGPKGMTRGLSAQIGPCPLTIERLSRQDAEKAYAQGVKLYSQQRDYLRARKLLNDAYNSGKLHEVQAGNCRELLTWLANQTILHPTPSVNPKDPYTLSYTFVSGDRLKSDFRGGKIIKPGVVARNNLNVPAEIIPTINGLKSATKFQADKAYKLIKGPFHIVVYKNARVADIYLQDLFLKRIPVCIGAPETPTPDGFFRIVDRTRQSVYNPPSGSGLSNKTLAPNDPGYPLGPRGLNIKIEGIPQLGTNIPVSQSYAIHGTNTPSSLGRATSRGCIRMGDDDINFTFAIMQSYGNPNSPAVSWDKWSTVWIRK